MKLNLNNVVVRAWVGFIYSGLDSCECGNEPSVFHRMGWISWLAQLLIRRFWRRNWFCDTTYTLLSKITIRFKYIYYSLYFRGALLDCLPGNQLSYMRFFMAFSTQLLDECRENNSVFAADLTIPISTYVSCRISISDRKTKHCCHIFVSPPAVERYKYNQERCTAETEPGNKNRATGSAPRQHVTSGHSCLTGRRRWRLSVDAVSRRPELITDTGDN
jgi:hypothetical protein